MSSDLETLLTYLEVEQIDKYLFIGNSPSKPSRIFGGQVLAQALSAASRSLDLEEQRLAHSMHAYFLRPGNPKKQIVFEVDPIRDGRSFTTRRVVAKQDGRAIFNTSVSFHVDEPGLSHQLLSIDVPPPEELESDHDYWVKMAEQYPDKFDAPTHNPIERKPVVRRDFMNPQPEEPEYQAWFRALVDLGDDPFRHQTVLAYFSDYALLSTALMPHPYTGMSKDVQSASLDHAIWFHRPCRADEHLLYAIDSPISSAARGFSRGSFYTRDGELVASTAQECLMRVRTEDKR